MTNIAEQHDIFKKLSGSTIATLIDTSNPSIKRCDTFPLITYGVAPDGDTITVIGEVFGDGSTKLIGIIKAGEEEQQIAASDIDDDDAGRYIEILNESYEAWKKTRH